MYTGCDCHIDRYGETERVGARPSVAECALDIGRMGGRDCRVWALASRHGNAGYALVTRLQVVARHKATGWALGIRLQSVRKRQRCGAGALGTWLQSGRSKQGCLVVARHKDYSGR